MYIVEVVQLNRIVKIHARREDYDEANTIFGKLKKVTCRELRMLKMSKGTRVLLKYVTKVRHTPKKQPTIAKVSYEG